MEKNAYIYISKNYHAMKEDRILTLHPEGKKGVNILRSKYERIRSFIIEQLAASGEMALQDLVDLAEEIIAPSFDGKVIWYMVTVKQDLEARGEIQRVPKVSPQR